MTDKTIKQRMERLRDHKSRAGEVQVKVWIPKERRAELLELAEQWRQDGASDERGN
jgi:hypothetical protein